MKIPKKILQAPIDELMSGNLKEVFKRNGYGGIPEWTNMGCAFFCYMDDKIGLYFIGMMKILNIRGVRV